MQDKQEKQKGKLSLRVLLPYFHQLKDQKGHLAIILTLMLLSTSVSLAIPIFAGRFVDAISEVSVSMPSGPQILILVGLLLLQMASSFLYQITSARLGLRIVTRLRRQLFAHILELPSLFFSTQKAGDISSRATRDVGAIQSILTGGVVAFLRAILTLIGALFLMLKLNPKLTIVVLLLIPATIGLNRIFGWRLQKLYRLMYDEMGNISSHVQETVGGIRSVKVYNAQNHQNDRFGEMAEQYRRAGLKQAGLRAALESASQISLWICLLAVVIYGFTLTASGETTGGQLVAFLLLAFRVTMPMASLTSLFTSAQEAVAAAGRLDDVFALEPERLPGSRTPAPDSRPVSINMKNVSFRYPGEDGGPLILENLNLDIPAGSWVGIVGPSGAGKTTLAGILMALLPPTSGALTMDGRPYSEQDISVLRSHMAWVAQDPILYDDSIRDNILFGLSDISEDKVLDAARRTGVSGFVESFSEGLETKCGERGSRLSGGQRQRVALARAFLRNPGLLVLDEPTSALDAESEESIRVAMREVMADRTTVVIAHRFSLVRDLDLILVVAEGKIVESGNHEELISNSGLYRTLYELQQGE